MKALFLILLSCASLGPHYQAGSVKSPKDEALITVYRPKNFVGGAADPYTCLDNLAVGEFYNGTYFDLKVTPGEHYISWGAPDGQVRNGLKFTARAGEHYFLRFDATKLTTAGDSIAASSAGARAAGHASAGAIGALVASSLLSSQEEISAMIQNKDARIQNKVHNAGLMFVKKDFAETELPATRLYITSDHYETKSCEARK